MSESSSSSSGGAAKANQLAIVVDRTEGTANVQVSGEIDLETSAELATALAGIRDGSVVHLDLHRVGFMDSTGLRAVLVARDDVRECGGDLDIVSASSIVTRLIQITGIDDLLAAG